MVPCSLDVGCIRGRRRRSVRAPGARGCYAEREPGAAIVAVVTAWEVYIKTLALAVVGYAIGEDAAALGSREDVDKLVDPRYGGLNVPKFCDARTMLCVALGIDPRSDDDDPMATLSADDLDRVVQLRHDIVHLRWDAQRRSDASLLPLSLQQVKRDIATLKSFVEDLEDGVRAVMTPKLGYVPPERAATPPHEEMTDHDH